MSSQTFGNGREKEVNATMAKSNGRGAAKTNMFLLLALGLIQYTVAFQTIGRNYETHINYVRPKSSELKMMNWEDIMFNAQSTASSMASVSLDDPSNLASSIPIMYGAGLLTGTELSLRRIENTFIFYDFDIR
ncbi:MAG: hypothetical protein ACI8RD_007125 [Bacillariaceae sp.]